MTGKSLDFNALTKTQQRFVRHLTKSEPHKVESCGTVNVAQALMRGRWIEPLEPGINQLLYHDTIRLTPAGQAAFEAAQAQPPAAPAPEPTSLVGMMPNEAEVEFWKRTASKYQKLRSEREVENADLRQRLAAAEAAIEEALSHLGHHTHAGAQYNPDLLTVDSILRKALARPDGGGEATNE